MIVAVDTTARTLTYDGQAVPCAIGRAGAVDFAAKREGDGATPRGRFALREVLFRPDRGLTEVQAGRSHLPSRRPGLDPGLGLSLPVPRSKESLGPDQVRADEGRNGDFVAPANALAVPLTALPWRWLARDDGWSDDPADPAYNTAVTHPHAFSAERLWRADGLYDVIVVLGWNDDPVVPGRGSAIFLHCTDPGHPATDGCVAIPRTALIALLPHLTANDRIDIA